MKVQYFYIHGIRFPGSLKLVGLRFRLSFFSGSHHVPWQRNYTMCSWPHSQQWNWVTHATTTQNMNTPVQTCPTTWSSQSAQFHSLFMMSPSDLLATPVSEYLQERCSPSSLRDIWKLKNLKRLTTYKNRFNKHPLSLKTQRKLCNTLRILRPRQFSSKLFHPA